MEMRSHGDSLQAATRAGVVVGWRARISTVLMVLMDGGRRWMEAASSNAKVHRRNTRVSDDDEIELEEDGDED